MEEEYNDFCRIGDYFKNKSSKKEEDDGGSFVSVIELRGYGLNVNIGFSCAKCETDFSINIDDCLYSKKRNLLAGFCPKCKTLYGRSVPFKKVRFAK